MDYEVTDWRGHANTHCPFCSFATVDTDGDAKVSAHVRHHHPVEIREALAAEMAAELEETRKAMNKEQLLDRATADLGIEGLTMRDSREDIEAAIAAKETEAAAAVTTAPGGE